MSKAEDRALERCPKSENVIEEMRNERRRAIFTEGYHQAEKDNELTWEDIRELHIIFAEVDVEIDFYKTDIKSETIGYYQEVLKRFKERTL